MKRLVFSVMALLCTISSIFSQGALPPTAMPELTDKEKTAVVNAVCKALKNEYVFPEVGSSASKIIEDNLNGGKYSSVKDVVEFSDVLTKDLQVYTKDGHFRVVFAPEEAEAIKNAQPKKEDPEVDKNKLEEGRANNFGFTELSILNGNIGYLQLKGFFPLNMAKETITAAMNFLANTDAIIIDLTQNRGGSIDMPPYLASYFLPEEEQTLLQFINRDKKEEDKTGTSLKLDGKRLVGKPLYILTSGTTFSAAEAFSYPLKNRKVAITIGEASGGGANPVVAKVLNSNFLLALPKVRPIDPLTGSNWEGTGVAPDIKVSVEKAKATAHVKALEDIAEKTKDPSTKWIADMLKGKYNPVTLSKATLKNYAGKYGERQITLQGNTLYYQKEGQSKFKLIPISEKTFLLGDEVELKIEIVVENGRVKGFNRLYIDGDKAFSKRD